LVAGVCGNDDKACDGSNETVSLKVDGPLVDDGTGAQVADGSVVSLLPTFDGFCVGLCVELSGIDAELGAAVDECKVGSRLFKAGLIDSSSVGESVDCALTTVGLSEMSPEEEKPIGGARIGDTVGSRVYK